MGASSSVPVSFLSKTSILLFFYILASQSPKRQLAIVLLTAGMMSVNILPACVAAKRRQSFAREAKDKGLAGQILCEASSKIDFRTAAAQAQWTVIEFPPCSRACKVIKSAFPFKHYLRDVTKIVPVLICSCLKLLVILCFQGFYTPCLLILCLHALVCANKQANMAFGTMIP